jgi:ectoine hydroxylase-related dioxygenase (phytanoyl-CoA dioxygenase family)
MNRVLSPDAVERYRRDGLLFPIDALPTAEAEALRRRYESQRDLIRGRTNQKPHLLFPWIAELVRHPRIVDAVEDLLGPDLLCWGAQFFTKPAGDAGFVSWHQDATYWGLSSPDVVTAWVALSPSNARSGCMRVIPGTHQSQLEHADTFDQANLLTRGQEITVEVDTRRAVDVVLEPGQYSLHHVLVHHASEPNRAEHPRIGLAIRYIPTHLRQTTGIRESATLVRGTDRHHHFDPEPRPAADLHPDAVAAHTQALERQLQVLYAGARQKGRLQA